MYWKLYKINSNINSVFIALIIYKKNKTAITQYFLTHTDQHTWQ